MLQRRTGEASKGKLRRAWSIPAYLVALALASTVPIAIVAGIFAYHFVSEASQQTRADFTERLRLLRNAVELRVENIVNDVEVLALSPALQSGDLAQFYRHAVAMRDLRDAFGVVLSDRQGQQIVNTRLPFGTALPHRSALEAQDRVFASGKPQISDLIYTTTERQPIISIEVPVRIGGEIRYVLALGLSPNYLSALMDAYVPADYVGSISDRKGILIARRPLQTGRDLVGKPTIPEVLAHIGEDSAFWIEATSRTGVPTYTSLLRSEQAGWTINLALPRDVIDGPIQRTVFVFAVIAALVLLVSLLFAHLISRRFLASLTGLEQHVMQVGSTRMIDPTPGPVAEVNRMETVLARVGNDIAAAETDLRHAMMRQQILLDEVNHRVKNTLATVQSIARLSMPSAGSVKEYVDAFEHRLIALSAAYNLLTENDWRGADLKALIERTLAPFAGGHRIAMDGPAIDMSPKLTLALAAAIQELSTNAAKYGSLSVPDGTLSVRWSRGADGRIALDWIERGGPPVAKPSRRGFGSRLIQDILAADSGWRVTLDYAPEGLTCTMLIAGARD
ncbi:MAG: sensor histidine kinase [Pseudolabrys sp.]